MKVLLLHQSYLGAVWVKPFNPSGNRDYGDGRQKPYYFRHHDIYVEWTAKSVAVSALKRINPERYGPLLWPYEPATPESNSAPYDGITYEIAAQLAALLKQNGESSPIHDYKVELVLETGFSQDGGFTFNQANIFHALMRMPDGGPLYDGYLPQGSGATGNINFGLTASGRLLADDPRLRMGPRDAPVIKLNTETELSGFGSAVNWRRPDSDEKNDRYRGWEVAGASHDDAMGIPDPSNLTLSGTVGLPVTCESDVPPNIWPNDFPYAFVSRAAAQALVEWIRYNRAPPHFSPIDQRDLQKPTAASIGRDKFGNALGGVRTPYVDVPTRTYHVLDKGDCRSIGWSTPLAPTTLRGLYRNHADYVRQFEASARATVARGAWLQEEADRAIKDARAAKGP